MVRAGLLRLILAGTFVVLLVYGSFAEEAVWRNDFNEVCEKTTEAMALSPQELKALIEKCDRVQKALAGEQETVVKVYTKRVKMCRDLYRYVLDSKEQAEKKESVPVPK